MEAKNKYVVYSDDFLGSIGSVTRSIVGHANSFEEAKKILVERCYRHDFETRKKMIEQINSHTEEELVGKDELVLIKELYFHEGIARVPGYMENESKETDTITLGGIIKRELSGNNKSEWELDVSEDPKKFIFQIKGCDKVYLCAKYLHIDGLPTNYVDGNCVYGFSVSENSFHAKRFSFNEKDFEGIDLEEATVREIDEILHKIFLRNKFFFSEEAAANSLPDELVIERSGHEAISITPYDKYGYHIEGISAYATISGSEGVFIHIKR